MMIIGQTQTFIETISIAGAVALTIVGVIIVLTLFFRGLSWISGTGSRPDRITLRGVLRKDTLVTVHLAGNKKFERVRFVGFINAQTSTTRLPYELSGMVILEDEQQQRYLVRAKNIQMIVITPDGKRE